MLHASGRSANALSKAPHLIFDQVRTLEILVVCFRPMLAPRTAMVVLSVLRVIRLPPRSPRSHDFVKDSSAQTQSREFHNHNEGESSCLVIALPCIASAAQQCS